jgi:hypothetical protein
MASLIRGPSIGVFVPTMQGIKYGFLTNNAKFKKYGDDLFGQTEFENQAGVVFGCNKPKPRRASKKFKDGRVSSFIDFNKAASLKKAQWRVTVNEKDIKIRTAGTFITVCVDTPFNFKYAWNLRAANLNIFKDFGVKKPAANDVLVFGTNLKPPIATQETTFGTISTFIAPNAADMKKATDKGFTVTGLDKKWRQDGNGILPGQ